MLNIRRFSARDESFQEEFTRFLNANVEPSADVSATVQSIIADICGNGDAALLKYTQQFDRLTVETAKQLEVSRQEIQGCPGSAGPG